MESLEALGDRSSRRCRRVERQLPRPAQPSLPLIGLGMTITAECQLKIDEMLRVRNFTGAAAVQAELEMYRMSRSPIGSARLCEDHQSEAAMHEAKISKLIASKDYAGAAALEAQMEDRRAGRRACHSSVAFVLESRQAEEAAH